MGLSIDVQCESPPHTPLSPCSPVPSLLSRRRGTTSTRGDVSPAAESGEPVLALDFSTLTTNPQWKEPPEPTNTLIFTNIHTELFTYPQSLIELRALIASSCSDSTRLVQWIPLKSFTRIVVLFDSPHTAQAIRHLFDGEAILDRKIKVYYGDPQLTALPSNDRNSLKAPPLEKNWLISPPGSPPVGWSQVREDPPNSNILPHDLVSALSDVAHRTGFMKSSQNKRNTECLPDDLIHEGQDNKHDTKSAVLSSPSFKEVGDDGRNLRKRAQSITILEMNEAEHAPGITVEDVDSAQADEDSIEEQTVYSAHSSMKNIKYSKTGVEAIRTSRPPVY